MSKDVGGNSCRICGKGENEGKLIAPCNGCDDSEKYIKVSCFKEWFENDDDFWKLQCPRCGGNFDGPEVVEIANDFFEKMKRGDCEDENLEHKLSPGKNTIKVCTIFKRGTVIIKNGRRFAGCISLQRSSV